jgi:hypothetical protein
MHVTRRTLTGAAVFVGLMSATALFGASTASATLEGTSCSGNGGTIKLSPGLTETPQVQNISIKGTVSGCTNGVFSGKYVAQLTTTNAVTCAALTSGGEVATGTIVLKWSPKRHGNSMGFFGIGLTEAPESPITGGIEKGPFEGASISGSMTQKYMGTCPGKKKVRKGTFTGTFNIS